MRHLVLPLIAAFAFVSSLVAADPSPQEIVKKYCALDANGARLSSETWKQIAPLIAWEDEPGWDEVTVISGYEIKSTKTTGKNATVAVTYHVLGVNGEKFTAKKHDESVVFKLARQKSGWKITEPSIEPHVTGETIVRHFRQIERDEPARRKELEKTISTINAGGVEISRDFGCTSRRRFDDGSFEEHELTLTISDDRVTGVAYSGTMSNGQEGGAYFCELDLEDGSAGSKWVRSERKTRVTETGTDRESYIEIEALADGSYKVDFENASSEHCGFGAEFPDSIVIKPSGSKCVVNK